MNRTIPSLMLFALCSSAAALEEQTTRAQVMLIGTFHFANPGKDVVKTKQMNVMNDQSQRYLQGLSERLAGFQPTVVLLEFDPKNEEEMQQRYRQYLEGTFPLPSNELYQLGFRIAKLAGLTSVFSFDEREIGWDAEPLFRYMPEHAPRAQARLDSLIEDITSTQKQDHATKSLAELLIKSNSEEYDRLNKYFYLLTNDVGVGDTDVGSAAAASWWHRNFRMYAKIQVHAQPGERVLVIGGQGHTAILKDFLTIDRDRRAIDVLPYLDE